MGTWVENSEQMKIVHIWTFKMEKFTLKIQDV